MPTSSILDSVHDEDFLAGLASATSWSGLLRALGYSGSPKPKVYSAARARAAELGIATAHLDERGSGPYAGWGREDLENAVAKHEGITEVAAALGSRVSTVRAAIARWNVPAEHLSGLEARCFSAPAPTLGVQLSSLRVAAEALASAWYTLRGAEVFTPANGTSRCDLLALLNGQTVRIQVKSTTFQHHGYYFVGVGTTGRSRAWERRTFDLAHADELFVVCGDGAMYRIPAEQAHGKAQVTLSGGYERYRVQMTE